MYCSQKNFLNYYSVYSSKLSVKKPFFFLIRLKFIDKMTPLPPPKENKSGLNLKELNIGNIKIYKEVRDI